MHIKIASFDFTEVWNGVLYKKLSAYPQISDWEIRCLIEFCDYEAANGRNCTWECTDAAVLAEIQTKMQNRAQYLKTPPPKKITECTACPRRHGCETPFVCHTTSPDAAISILRDGMLLSAVRARRLPAEILMREKRNAAGDPADYFDYIMFAWGNCQAGDRLVMERALGRFPTEEELSSHFVPGIRFYFRYETLAAHPNAVFDGVLPLKIRDALPLADSLYRIVIPSCHAAQLMSHLPVSLADRVTVLPYEGEGLWDWTEKVYCTIAADIRTP